MITLINILRFQWNLVKFCRLRESVCNLHDFFSGVRFIERRSPQNQIFMTKILKEILRFKMPLVTEMGLDLLHKTQEKVPQNTKMKEATVPEGCEGPHENLGVPITFSALEVVPWITKRGWKRERTVHRLGEVSTGHVMTAHKGCNIVQRHPISVKSGYPQQYSSIRVKTGDSQCRCYIFLMHCDSQHQLIFFVTSGYAE